MRPLDYTDLRLYAENDGAFFDKHIAPFMKKFHKVLSAPSIEKDKKRSHIDEALKASLKMAEAAAKSYWLELVAQSKTEPITNPLTLFPETERKRLAAYWVSKLQRTPRHGL
jgi:hypothetical protein